jgi:hypothetical protein
MLESCSEVSCGGDYKVGGERGGNGVLSWEPHCVPEIRSRGVPNIDSAATVAVSGRAIRRR